MVEPPPIVAEPFVPPPISNKNPGRGALMTAGVLVFLLVFVSNIVAIPFLIVGTYDKIFKPILVGSEVAFYYRNDLTARELSDIKTGLKTELPNTSVESTPQSRDGMIRIRSDTERRSVPVYQEKLDKVVKETGVDPGKFGAVAKDFPRVDYAGLLKDPMILVGSALSIQITILLIWLVGRKRYFTGERELGPFHIGRWQKPVAIGLALGLPVALGANAIDSLLRVALHVPNSTIWDIAASFPLWAKVGIVVTGVLGAPILEELFFRGMLIGVFQRIGQTNWGIGVSAVMFGLAHLSDVPTVLTITAMGLVLGIVYTKTKSLYTTIAIHMVNNAVSFWILFNAAVPPVR